MINFKNDIPIYLQIREEIEEAILANRLKEEEQIPSIRGLSAQYKVNPNTISNAYTELESSAIIYKKRGRGFFVNNGARKKLLEEKKKKFLNNVLTDFVAKAKIIDIDLEIIIEEIKQRYFKGDK